MITVMKYMFFMIAGLVSMSWAPADVSDMRSGDKVMVDTVVEHDLYVAAGMVVVQAPVHGDLVTAGGTVMVQDTVTQDLLIAGGDVTVSGFVGDDVRCAAGTVTLSGTVAGDVIVTGGRVVLAKTALVLGNLVSSGGEVTIDGTVRGNIDDASGTFTLNGVGERNVTCRGGRIVANGAVKGSAVLAAETIAIGPAATFGQDVRYWNRAGTLAVEKPQQSIRATYDPALEINGAHWQYLGFASLIMALWYLATALVMIVVIQYLFSRTLLSAATTVRTVSLKSMGVGFLFLIGVPVGIVFLFVTVIGIPLGILALLAYATLVVLATIIVALLMANWINNTFYESAWGNPRIVATAFLIFVVLKLVTFTPLVGPLVMLLLVAMAFGAILLNVKWARTKALDLT
jgi:cytoskeletal protein CcmA (bactofilin family)